LIGDAENRSSFDSFFMAGFECSTHVGLRGYRHDVLRDTRHDTLVLEDYKLLRSIGIRTVREGLRWHLVEPQPGRYDFSSVIPMMQAAQLTGTQVIWDIMHFGIPDDLDVYSSAFVHRLEGLAKAFAVVLNDFTRDPWFTPVNEISFLSFAGGDAGFFAPFQRGSGHELKRQLARASIAATHACLEVNPKSRFMQPEPVIHIASSSSRPWEAEHAAGHRGAQFQAWDMLAGRFEPELGGEERLLDVLGLNFYPNNQWEHGGSHFRLGDPRWMPFSAILHEISARYEREMIVSETGAEGGHRAPWLEYVSSEVEQAILGGVPVHGICLYPILDHPGWDDDRHVQCGLYGFRRRGERRPDAAYGAELTRWQGRLEREVSMAH
jgi:Beta-galactosidase